MQRNTLLPLIIMPGYKKYEDRALMFSTLIEINGDGELHFHNNPISLKPDFSYSSPRKTNSFHKWIYTLKITYKWMIKSRSNIIIHDLFAPRGIFIPKRKNTKKVLSLYSDTANYYYGKRYKNDLKNKTLANKIFFHFLYLRRSVYEYIGILLADGVIANSPEIIEGIKKYYKIKNKNFGIINTCIDTDFWKILNTKREMNLIFYAGRLSKRKGLDVLLKSFKDLNKQNPNLKLVIAGKETKEESFQWGYKYIHDNNLSSNIEFIGEIDRNQMREWYNKSSVFILPSIQEGSPRVVKEAMACGCPVICSELPGTIILDPKKTILCFFKANDKVELSGEIESLFNQINQRTNNEANRNYAIDNFSPKIIAGKTLNFYRSLYTNAN